MDIDLWETSAKLQGLLGVLVGLGGVFYTNHVGFDPCYQSIYH